MQLTGMHTSEAVLSRGLERRQGASLSKSQPLMGSQAVGGSFKESADPFTHLSSSPLLLTQQQTPGTLRTACQAPSSAPVHLEVKGILDKLKRQPVTLTRSSASPSQALQVFGAEGIHGPKQTYIQTGRGANRTGSPLSSRLYRDPVSTATSRGGFWETVWLGGRKPAFCSQTNLHSKSGCAAHKL